MKQRAAFTLIEVLITIIICGVIVTELSQLIRNSLGLARRVRTTIESDRDVSMMLDQLMYDFSAAYEGRPYERRPPGYVLKNTRLINAGDKARKIGKEDFMSSEELSEHKAPYPFFTATVQDTDEIVRFEGQHRDMLEVVNFITTYPFEVYDSYKKYFVRVAYTLSRDDRPGVTDKDTYTLYRKETMDVFNTKLAEPEEGDRAPWDKKVYTYRIAQNIKHLSLKFRAPKPKPKDAPSKKKKQPEKQEMISAFEWGESEQAKTLMPHTCHAYIQMWDKARERFYEYSVLIPIFARKFVEDRTRSSAPLEPNSNLPVTPPKQGPVDHATTATSS